MHLNLRRCARISRRPSPTFHPALSSPEALASTPRLPRIHFTAFIRPRLCLRFSCSLAACFRPLRLSLFPFLLDADAPRRTNQNGSRTHAAPARTRTRTGLGICARLGRRWGVGSLWGLLAPNLRGKARRGRGRKVYVCMWNVEYGMYAFVFCVCLSLFFPPCPRCPLVSL
ncbi:hypothetical protein C8R45DRAFT_497640 [Mycena sanguinolenta]|nr:hypothetical protein C8R45DRAFT_497640 [Mycena sanguinolenta]